MEMKDKPHALEPDSEDRARTAATAEEKQQFFMRQIDRWVEAMERLRLVDYIRYADDRKRMFWSNFWGGVARGVGMAVGFTILGALLVLLLRDLAQRNLPLIGDALAQIVNVVQRQME